MVTLAELTKWIRHLKPKSLQYQTADDDDWRAHVILGGAAPAWKKTASALLAAKATCVQAIGDDDAVLDTLPLREEAEPATEARSLGAAKDTAALALVLDAQGKRLSEAFTAGAEAASRGQDNLVQVVNILTAQWSATMNAVHQLSMQLAKALRAAGGGDTDEDDGMSQQMQQLLGIAAMKMMGMNGAAPATDAPPTKGK